MIVNFRQFLNETIKYSQLMKFNIDEFRSSNMEQVGEDILILLGNDKCILIDSNGDEDEYEVYERLCSIADSQEKNSVITNYEMEQDQDYAVMTYYDKFPIIGKAIKVSRGESHFDASNNTEFMFFLSPSFKPDTFMELSMGHMAGKKFNL